MATFQGVISKENTQGETAKKIGMTNVPR